MDEQKLEEGKILIIDDEEGNVRVLERLLKQAGFINIYSLTDSRQAIENYRKIRPDLVLLDLKMPHLDGFGVMDALKTMNGDSYLPVLVITAQRDHTTRLKALRSGAKDFLSKPFQMTEALTRVRNMLEVRLLHNKVIDQNRNLESKVRDRTRELEESRLEIIHRLGRAAEYRDNETGLHVIRMSHLCGRLGREAGLDEARCELLLHAAPLHDIGKIGIPDQILLKAGKLSEEEWEMMRLHPIIGAEILSGSDSEMMQLAELMCRTHQERWDGSGYPMGLQGEEIPLEGRIVALCDVFDALVCKRPYKEAYSMEKAMEILESKSGIDFDPQLVEAFKRILPEIGEIMKEFAELDQPELPQNFHPASH
ncbi:MAG: HD-GYP domain-containing protein [Nitrospinaceae bacterium]